MQRIHLLLYIAIVLGVLGTDDVDAGCDVLKSHEIAGGKTVVLQNNTLLQYICPEGQYPYPVEYRTCGSGNLWSTMKNINNARVFRAMCKVIQCPRIIEFENGYYEPPQQHYNISQNITFTCYGGYNMKGSKVRICLPNGKWSGKTTICDDGTGHCTNPGIPIGSRKEGNQYRIEYRVRYSCERGLVLYGSKERTCLESGWSGSEPECRQPYTFDTPEEVANSFITSLTETAEAADSNRNISATQKRKIVIKKGGTMNIYFLLDASKSIKEDDFNSTQNVTIKLIEKISNYDVSPNYAVITFATNTREVFNTIHARSTDAAWVIEQLQNITVSEHKVKPGTNIKKALTAVYEMMITQEADERRRKLNPPPVSNSTRHVIILLSDGRYNMGGDPAPVMDNIKEFLRIKKSGSNSRNEFLDVYAFAVGEVNEKTMNDLVSHKPDEMHFFKVKNITDLQKTFDDMIDESEVLSMCGLAKEHQIRNQQKNPWNTKITITRAAGAGFDNCKGTLVSEYFILTAAHCFTIDDTAEQIKVTIDKKDYRVAVIRLHPKYEIGKLKNQGIPEFYDYDVALIKLEKKVEFSFNARPICLPCTQGTTRALRKSLVTTCRDHENELLPVGNTRSFFVSDCKTKNEGNSELLRRHVQIKNSDKKMSCEQDARNAKFYKNITNIKDVVTDNFLCTGGQEPVLDPNTCKGDSGGPLIIQKKLRYIQVGVISWGVTDVCNHRIATCEEPDKFQRNAPSYARDFHLNLFKVIPWLKKELADEGLEFI